MTHGMRKGLTSYGDADFSLFLRKAFIKAMGLSDDALARPIVGIANTFSDYNACHGNVPKLVEAIKRGVMLAGGLPMEFPTISIHESFAYPTSMFLRNLMAMDTEEMLRAQPMDSVVLIGGCDKTIPAQMMAAASADVPAVFVPVGPMLVGHHQGEQLGACTDCRRLWGEYRGGRIDAAQIEAINERLAPTPGTCMVMGTASTMACIVEVMGLALPRSATIPATHADRLRSAEASGKQAVALAAGGLPKPSEVMTAAAFRNALIVLQAIGGSTNALIHLTAAAGRLGLTVDLAEVDRLGREVPVLVDLKPSGVHYMEHFHWAGGVPRLLHELKDLLDLDAPTVLGGTLRDYLDGAEIDPHQHVIRARHAPITAQGGIAVLRGNLAPRGAIIKQSAASPTLMNHTGRALVFDSVEDMSLRIDSPDLDVNADDVLVLRNAGPIGAPGMPEAGYLPIPRKLAMQGVKDMVRLSDARMSGTAFGTIVLHVTPEAAIGGPLALVRDGDSILLDVAARRIELLVDDAELAQRRAARPGAGAAPTPDRGYAALFHRSVLQADEGCDFDFLVPGHCVAGRRGVAGAGRVQPVSRPRGVIAAAATPLNADFTPDLQRLTRHCRALLDTGCDAIHLLGTTGEATAFSVAQRLAVMRSIGEAGLPLDRFLVGTGVCALEDTVTLTRAAAELGFAGALLLPPFFHPDVPADGLIAHVDEVVRRAAHPDLAIYLHHIPQNTGVPWPPEVVSALRRQHPAVVVGLKDSAGDLAYARAMAREHPGFDVFPSSEASLASAASDGFAGCISATTNLTAPYAQAAWSAQGTEAGAAAVLKAGELRGLIARYPLVASVKAALAAAYRDAAWSRVAPPLRPLTAAQASALAESLEERMSRP